MTDLYLSAYSNACRCLPVHFLARLTVKVYYFVGLLVHLRPLNLLYSDLKKKEKHHFYKIAVWVYIYSTCSLNK